MATAAPTLPSAICSFIMRFQASLGVLAWLLGPVVDATNSTSTSDSDSNSSMVKGMLAGLGGFVGLIVLICLLWCCCCTDDENSCKGVSNCFKRNKKNGHPYEDRPGYDPGRPPRHAKDKGKVTPSPPQVGNNLRAPSQWSHAR